MTSPAANRLVVGVSGSSLSSAMKRLALAEVLPHRVSALFSVIEVSNSHLSTNTHHHVILLVLEYNTIQYNTIQQSRRNLDGN